MNNPIIKKKPNWLVLFIMLSFIMTEHAFAHNVTIFAWVEGNTVYTESKFSRGKKAKNAPIEVYDAKGKKLLKGKTNENGEFSFKAPQKTDMTIVLLAGMGHQAKWAISAKEFNGMDGGTIPQTAKKAPIVTEPENTIQPIPLSNSHYSEIELAVEKALDKKMEPLLDKKLQPILKILRESRQKAPSIGDILGGIGYILGLVGIGAYVNYRQGNRM